MVVSDVPEMSVANISPNIFLSVQQNKEIAGLELGGEIHEGAFWVEYPVGFVDMGWNSGS